MLEAASVTERWCAVVGPTVERFPIAGGVAVMATWRSPHREGDNEDSAYLQSVGPDGGVLAIADGAGGLPAGADASRLALEALEAALTARARGSVRAAILDGFEAANEAVRGLKVGAATTLAAVEIAEGVIRPYHVGDSRVLVTGQRGRRKLWTVAHSPTAYAVEAGFLTPSDALHHEEAPYVLNIVGADDMRIELGAPLALAPRDTLLVASDGIFDNFVVDEVAALIRRGPPEVAARRLMERARQRMTDPEPGAPSKADDLSFILYRRDPRRPMKDDASG